MPLPIYTDKKEQSPSSPRRVIAVAAGKGGVGKSTVAVNLARALKKSGNKVGLMDTDVYGPSIRKMMPEDRMPTQRADGIGPALAEGIRVISMAYFRGEGEASVVRAPIANNIVSQFIQNVHWGDLDYLVVDFPPGTGDVQLTLSQKANLSGAVMVATPQQIALMDVRKAMDMFKQVNVPIIGIVENMSGYFDQRTKEWLYLFGRGGGEKLAREMGVPFLGSVPIDPELNRSCDEGWSIFDKPTDPPLSVESFFRIEKNVRQHLDVLEKDPNALHSFEITWREMPS